MKKELFIVYSVYNNTPQTFGTFEECQSFIDEMEDLAPNANFYIGEIPDDPDEDGEYDYFPPCEEEADLSFPVYPRRKRRAATRAAKIRNKNIYKNMRINPAFRPIVKNGDEVSYIHEGNTYRWDWKRYESRLNRRSGKKICRTYDEILDDVEDSFLYDWI